MATVLFEEEIELSYKYQDITWSISHLIDKSLGGWNPLPLSHKGYSKNKIPQYMETRIYTMHYKLGQAIITNWGSFVLLQIGAAQLLESGTSVIKNWGSY